MIARSFHDVAKLEKFAQWQKKYDGQLKTEADMDQAIAAMVASLNDPYTTYTSPTQIHQHFVESDKGVTTAGLMVKTDSQGNKVIDYLGYGSAAYASELKRGDVITKITNGTDSFDQAALAKMSTADVESHLQGQVASVVTIDCRRGAQNLQVKLTLVEIPDEDAVAKILPTDILYLRLPEVSEDAVYDFENVIAETIGKATNPIRGIVLDLRGNPGGQENLEEGLIGLFLESGKLYTKRNRLARIVTTTTGEVVPNPPYITDNETDADKTEDDVLFHKPLVILADGSTASAAEITVQALQQNKRGRFVGTRTYGKDVGYEMDRLPNGGVLQITSLDLYGVAGQRWQTGIGPDVSVEQTHGDSKGDAQLTAGIAELEKMIAAAAKVK